ncbi:2,4-dienoyl-CoA reductase [Thermomonospora echinospora]|uniref:2,4-dienoyl-CoA reductase n=1 Tax=Thermomonospora echinospora TaxID=1992 RepID=A0A1H6DMI4_9ACTN|nr:alkene reductase [Thermomonospora echinospora]SEG86597.1 2,4-dienoyl-CoA reductase [Thermomonospora echinospora]
MTSLFDGFDLRGLCLPNRVVMAPMTRARALTGVPDDMTTRYYAQRADAGLIVSEGSPVSKEGTGYAFTPGLYTDEQVAGWRSVTDAVRAQKGRMFAQLWHVGWASHVSLQENGKVPVSSTANAVGTVAFAYRPDGSTGMLPATPPRALGADEVARVVADFAAAAANADAAGFHGIELQAANGYLFEQFLNSRVNDRMDRYGATTVADRIRFTLEVVDAVADRIGAHRVGIRLSPYSTINFMPADDKTDETYRALGDELASRGIAYIHVSDNSDHRSEIGRAAGEELSAFLREWRPVLGDTALVLAGRQSLEKATRLIGEGTIDLAAFGRPFISNPDLVERLREGIPLAKPDRATYYTGGVRGYVDYPAAGRPASPGEGRERRAVRVVPARDQQGRPERGLV